MKYSKLAALITALLISAGLARGLRLLVLKLNIQRIALRFALFGVNMHLPSLNVC